MKVMIDTNVLVSAILNPDGLPHKAYVKSVTSPHRAMIAEQTVSELRRVFQRKFPYKMLRLEKFLAVACQTLRVVPVPSHEIPAEAMVRDVDDRPILRAALAEKADVLLTGDRDFLESGISLIKIMTPADFLMKT